MNHTTTTTTNCNQVVWNVVMAKPPERPQYVPSIDRDVLNDLTLAWWRISGYIRDNGMSVDKKHEKMGWWGLTVTNMSDHEHAEIKRWHKSKGSDAVYLSPRDYECGGEMWVVHFIGSYKDYCVNLWFSTEDLLLEFVQLLKSFPVRKTVLLLGNPAAAKQFIKSTNYKIIEGADKYALGLTEEVSDCDLTLIRLAAV